MELTPEQKKAIDEQKEHCPFCMMVSGKIPAEKVYEDDRIMAVLDINPASPGHLLVMPKEHYPIMPLIPPEEFTYLFERVREIGKYLREAMVVPQTHVFVANGQAAGQQSTHFLVHVIPSNQKPAHFALTPSSHDPQRLTEIGDMLKHNLPIMLRDRSKLFPLQGAAPQATPTGPVSDLALLIEQNPQLKQLLMENPDAVLAGIEENPSLKPLFEGVDVHALSEKLREQEMHTSDLPATDTPTQTPTQIPTQEQAPQPIPTPPPQQSVPTPNVTTQQSEPQQTPAVAMTDAQLVAFIDSKNALKDYLLTDVETLKDAIEMQPKLKVFFEQTTPEEVLARYKAATSQDAGRRFGGNF